MRIVASLLFVLVSAIAVGQKELTTKAIWTDHEFSTDYVSSVASMNDGEHFSALEGNKIVKYSYKNFDKPVGDIYTSTLPEKTRINGYSFNADETQLLLVTNRKGIYRRSFTAEYYVVNLRDSKTEKLHSEGPQMLADFSPDGSKVAFVYDNNLYYKELSSGKVTQITNDGKRNEIINGSSDWVYEEEFSITKCWYWSPNSDRIAYLKFNESDVKEFTMDYYFGGTYPTPYTFRYPKAGEDNSKLSLHIFDLGAAKSESVANDDEYIPRMKWSADNSRLIFVTLNRHQNHIKYIAADYKGGKISTTTILEEKSDTYVEVDDNLLFLKDGSGFIRTSEADGFRHIYLHTFNGEKKQLTSGSYDVIDLLGFNEKDRKVYFTSSEEGAIYKALYVVGLDGSGKKKLSSKKGSNSASFSTGMKYYINYYSNANEPYYISVHEANGKEITKLVDNSELKEKLQDYKLSQKEFITIKGVEHDLNAYIIKPPNFDESKKYPVYFNIYNGPGSNTVKDSWGGTSMMYLHLLAQKGYIILSVDTRGTMNRGRDFKNCTYQQLGKLETEDMIAVAKEVQKWSYVDPERIGVMGWSYGGYMSSLCMTKGADVFKMGIAVAPVTNWRWYDNIYTERYMRTPQENPNGYDDNSPINHVEKMKGKYLLVHGSGDDNVHVQNTMEMVNTLVKKNVDFDMFIYTNKAHGIGGGYTREHLFSKMLAFTLENL